MKERVPPRFFPQVFPLDAILEDDMKVYYPWRCKNDLRTTKNVIALRAFSKNDLTG